MFKDDGVIRVLEGPGSFNDQMTDEVELSPESVRSKFKKFVKEYKYSSDGNMGHIGTLKYRDQFIRNCEQGIHKLEINLNDLDGGAHEDGEALAQALWQRPTEFIPLCEKGLKELFSELVRSDGRSPHVQLQFKCDIDLESTFGTRRPTMIRELVADRVEELVVVQGIVVQQRRARHKARVLHLKCKNCENVTEITVNPGLSSAHIPTTCEGRNLAAAMDKCPMSPWLIVSERCEFVDEQTLKLQELPEHVPIGEMPRSIDVVCDQHFVDSCTPGTRLTAIGVYCATEYSAGAAMGGSRSRGTNTVKYSYLQVLGLEAASGGNAQIKITNEEEEEFLAMARDPNIREKIFDSIAPAIKASSKDVIADVKRAVACCLFGGSRKELPDGTRMRGDINVLLLGDPGTAKSQFLKFAEKASPIAVYTSGKGSSAAGLTASVIRSQEGFALEGGAMVLADGGIVCIDEFDKMDPKDRVAIHEAMEQQTISIAKAGITTMLNTRCSVLAAANPRFGTYDDLASTSEQMDFESTILSRFDMMFLVRDVRDPQRDYDLAKHLAGLHKGEIASEAEGELPVAKLRKYLNYCRGKCQPRISNEAGETLANHYISIRKSMKEEKEAGRDSAIPITVRQLEAIIRMSESLAKMALRDEVDMEHVEEALRLFTVSTLDSANKDRAAMGGNMTDEERDAVKQAEEQVRRRVARGSRISKFALEQWLVSAGGVEDRIARKAVNIMVRSGELTEKTGMTLQRAT